MVTNMNKIITFLPQIISPTISLTAVVELWITLYKIRSTEKYKDESVRGYVLSNE
jgi:hypothetical protein